MKPTTPLPFRAMVRALDAAILKSEKTRAESRIAGFVQGHLDELEQRWDAYPKLVAALNDVIFEREVGQTRAGELKSAARYRALLAELGEAN